MPGFVDLIVPEIVLVSGAPGSGKSTLARHLARTLRMNFISKELVKESLWDALDPPAGDLEWSRRMDAAAMEVVWTLAAQSQPAVLEANFRPHSDFEKAKLLGLSAKLVEVHCSCPPEVALHRYERGANQPGLHPSRITPTFDAALLADFDQPVGLGSVIEVDTTRVIEIKELAKVIAADLTDLTDLQIYAADRGFSRAAIVGMTA